MAIVNAKIGPTVKSPIRTIVFYLDAGALLSSVSASQDFRARTAVVHQGADIQVINANQTVIVCRVPAYATQVGEGPAVI